jgi:opacity protein-like surface antigen
MLLHAGVEPDRANPEGQTALHYATRPDDSEVVRILLVAGAALEAPTNDGSTALMLAAETGHRQTLRVLADAGARIEATDELGNTPLMRAAAADESRTLEDLLRRGASKRARNANGLHALGIAKTKGSGAVRRVFDHIKPVQFSYIKLGANLSRLTDPQHASSVGGEFGMSVAAKVLTRLHFQIDGASVIRVTDPGEEGPVSFGAPGDFYYSIYSFEVRPQVRFTLGNPYRRHAYVLAGAGFGSVVAAELRDYSGQTDEEVVTDNTDESFTSINFGLGYEVDLTRSIVTLELTYSHIPSMRVDRFEGGFDTFAFSLGLGL